MKKALLVMDLQNVCVGQTHASFFKYGEKELLEKVNQVIDNSDADLIVYIQQVMKKTFLNRLSPIKAYEDSFEVELVKELHVVSDYVFKKYVGNAFSNPDLCKLLKEHEIESIELVGVDGGGCVALTALGAIECGYKVTLIEDAIGTMLVKKKLKYNNKLRALGATFA